MQGNRRSDNTPVTELRPGEYAKQTWVSSGVTWFIRDPDGHIGSLVTHAITEHEDGSITVSPSIAIDQPGVGRWHGYLERGVWRV